MNTPQHSAGGSGGGKGAVAVMSLVVAGIIVALAPSEGDKKVPYYDQAGVLTVCKGITGKGVIKGKTYTQAECDKLETDYVTKMVTTMGRCIHVPMTYGEWIAYGHWSYNVGTSAFCNSTLNKHLNAGNRYQACREMGRWTYITKPGIGKVNCRDPKQRCGGLPKRRDFEVQMCMAAIGG